MALEKTQCPKCGKAFRFASEHLGSKTRCKSCQAIFVIAGPGKASSAVQAKPIVAKPAQATPVAPKPVQAKPVQAKPVQAQPVQPKPVQAKPTTAKPVVAKSVAAKSVVAKPEASPYEAFADEIMTGNNVVTAQRLTTASGNGNAAAYLATNRKLNSSKKKARSSDWATTFIFRGVSLAIFGCLLLGISMLGMATFAFLSGPIGAMIAVAVGLVGSVMVMIGFATKPGSAAACGLIPAILFVAGGLLVGKLFLDGYWGSASQNMAVAQGDQLGFQQFAGQNGQPQRKGNFNAVPFGGDPLAELRKEQERDRVARQKNLAERRNQQGNRVRQNGGVGGGIGPDPMPSSPFEDVRKQHERIMKDAMDRSKQSAKAMQDSVKKALDRSQSGIGSDVDPFNPPKAKDVLGGIPKLGGTPVDDDPFVESNRNVADKPDPAEASSQKNDTASVDDPEQEETVQEIPDLFDNRQISRLSIKLRSNASRKYGGGAVFNFPTKNLTKGALGQESKSIAYPLIGDSGQYVIGFDAVRQPRRSYVQGMIPVFAQTDASLTTAKQGYVVGGFEAAFVNNEMVLFRVIYMKLAGKKLDESDQYFSDWFGDADQIANAKQITTEGRPVIGVRLHGSGKISGLEFIKK